MHIKMLLMGQGGGNKKECHIPKAQSRKLSSPSLEFFSFTGHRGEDEPLVLWQCFVPS